MRVSWHAITWSLVVGAFLLSPTNAHAAWELQSHTWDPSNPNYVYVQADASEFAYSSVVKTCTTGSEAGGILQVTGELNSGAEDWAVADALVASTFKASYEWDALVEPGDTDIVADAIHTSAVNSTGDTAGAVARTRDHEQVQVSEAFATGTDQDQDVQPDFVILGDNICADRYVLNAQYSCEVELSASCGHLEVFEAITVYAKVSLSIYCQAHP